VEQKRLNFIATLKAFRDIGASTGRKDRAGKDRAEEREQLSEHTLEGKELNDIITAYVSSKSALDQIIKNEFEAQQSMYNQNKTADFPRFMQPPEKLNFAETIENLQNADQTRREIEQVYATYERTRFMVIVSSSRPCHRSREIGLDPIFMDSELSQRPIVVNLTDGVPSSALEQFTTVPENFVIFTPVADVTSFPFPAQRIMMKTPAGFSLCDLMSAQYTQVPAAAPSSTDGQTLLSRRPEAKAPFRGLSNLGATCYFNATMQALCASSVFRNLIESSSGAVGQALRGLFKAIMQPGNTITDTKWNAIALQVYNWWRVGFQQDAQELMNALIDRILEEEIAQAIQTIKSKAQSQLPADEAIRAWLCGHEWDEKFGDYETMRDTLDAATVSSLMPIATSMIGRGTSTTTCQQCGTSSSMADSFTILPLSVQSFDGLGLYGTLDECMRHLSDSEQMTGDNMWRCPKCKKLEKASKVYQIIKCPPILIIQLKRFKYSDTTIERLGHLISYDEILHFNGKAYTLKAVINHIGNSPQRGHYIATVRASDGRWYTADDANATGPYNFSVSKDAYILLYEEEQANPNPASASAAESQATDETVPTAEPEHLLEDIESPPTDVSQTGGTESPLTDTH
jgi:ubiquitin C-terminal hydrolase